jgi:iron complex transport system substrate-binding protein
VRSPKSSGSMPRWRAHGTLRRASRTGCWRCRGLANAGAELGLKAGGYASLEAIVALRPDFILVSDGGDFAEDEGRAFLLHPALERFYPAAKRIVLPERLTICGGPMLSEALDRLASELERVAREPEPVDD